MTLNYIYAVYAFVMTGALLYFAAMYLITKGEYNELKWRAYQLQSDDTDKTYKIEHLERELKYAKENGERWHESLERSQELLAGIRTQIDGEIEQKKK